MRRIRERPSDAASIRAPAPRTAGLRHGWSAWSGWDSGVTAPRGMRGGEDAGGQRATPTRRSPSSCRSRLAGRPDTVTRLVAEPMSAKLGQQIVVRERRGGGGHGRGPVRWPTPAAPRTRTGVIRRIGMSTAPALYPNLAYKPLEDFKNRRSGRTTSCAMDFEPNTLQELVTYVKAKCAGDLRQRRDRCRLPGCAV